MMVMALVAAISGAYLSPPIRFGSATATMIKPSAIANRNTDLRRGSGCWRRGWRGLLLLLLGFADQSIVGGCRFGAVVDVDRHALVREKSVRAGSAERC